MLKQEKQVEHYPLKISSKPKPPADSSTNGSAMGSKFIFLESKHVSCLAFRCCPFGSLLPQKFSGLKVMEQPHCFS